MVGYHSRLLCIAGVLCVLSGARVPAATSDSYDPWPGLVQDIFSNRPMNDGGGVTPLRCHIVPRMRQSFPHVANDTTAGRRPPGAADYAGDRSKSRADGGEVRTRSGRKVSEISTRVRVNNYTNVHAVAELSDGKLYMVQTYVKASGGCSAPAAKNADETRGRLGQMRYRQFAKAGEGLTSGAREAQIMIGHPNNSGLQMDQVSQLYIPAFFVNELHLWQDDSPVLTMEGGISISEDPNIRFTYVANGAKRFRAEARDTDGHLFQHEWKIDASGI